MVDTGYYHTPAQNVPLSQAPPPTPNPFRTSVVRAPPATGNPMLYPFSQLPASQQQPDLYPFHQLPASMQSQPNINVPQPGAGNLWDALRALFSGQQAPAPQGQGMTGMLQPRGQAGGGTDALGNPFNRFG